MKHKRWGPCGRPTCTRYVPVIGGRFVVSRIDRCGVRLSPGRPLSYTYSGARMRAGGSQSARRLEQVRLAGGFTRRCCRRARSPCCAAARRRAGSAGSTPCAARRSGGAAPGAGGGHGCQAGPASQAVEGQPARQQTPQGPDGLWMRRSHSACLRGHSTTHRTSEHSPVSVMRPMVPSSGKKSGDSIWFCGQGRRE